MLRPEGAPPSYVCSRCRLILYDGVDYTWCPACSAPVDWVAMDRPAAPPPRAGSRAVAGMAGVGLSAMTLMYLGQLVVTALDPLGFALVAPLLLVAVIGAGCLLVAVAASLGELRHLVRDRRTRVIHGLEHACAQLLERAGHPVLAGQAHPGFFALEVVNDGRASTTAVEQATAEAIARITAGERALALDPRCGTSLLVGAVSVSALLVAATIAGLVAGIAHGPLILGTAIAALGVWRGARRLGLLVQRTLTVSTAFAAARGHRIVRVPSASGDTAAFLVYVQVFLTPPPALDGRPCALAQPRGCRAPRLPRLYGLPPGAWCSGRAPAALDPADLSALQFTLAQPRGYQAPVDP